MSAVLTSRRYIDGPFGQLHVRQWRRSDDDGVPLVCLAPSPYSGIAYATIAPLLAAAQPVIAMDYPGYGQSDATPQPPSIDDYACAALAVADALSPDAPVNLLGFHTGTLVATQAAIAQPGRIARAVLVDVPFFSPEQCATFARAKPVPRALSASLDSLAGDWSFSVTKRLDQVPLWRGFELFADQISVGPGMNAAFLAAFDYPCADRFARLQGPSLVVATKAGLHEQSCAAAAVMPGAQLREVLDVEVAVLEQGAARIARVVNAYLSNTDGE